jgi:hypothetical protein
MRRTLPLLAALILAVLAVVAGPALSARPYQPEPVDFELRGPAAKPSAARGGREYVSPPLRAPKRFNTVGLRWRGDDDHVHLRVRVKRNGGKWTRWQEMPTGSAEGPDRGQGESVREGVTGPAWAGQSDWIQYRSERRLPGVRLHFVNTTGTATAADRRRTAFRRAVNGGVVALAKLPSALVADADAAEEQPPIVSRDGWNGDRCPPRDAPTYSEVNMAFVHHTVNLNDYSRSEAKAVVLGICRFHRNDRGWDDIGYNFLVDKYGTIYEGRAGGIDQPVMGAQAQGFNAQSTGIANIGTFEDVPQSPEAIESMAKLIRWKLPLHGVPTSGRVTLTSAGGASNRYPAGRQVRFNRISGHRDGNQTSCPGGALYAQLPELRRQVGDVQPTGAATNATRLGVRRSKVVTYPRPARVAGTLRSYNGVPTQGLTVELQRLSSGGTFRTIATTTSDEDDKYEFELKPSRRTVVRVRFPGDANYGASESRAATIQVRPGLTFAQPASEVRPKALITVPGTVKPRKGYVWLQVQRRSGSRYRSFVWLRKKTTRSGRFKLGFRARRTGLYRMRIVTRKDKRNLARKSKYFKVRVSRSVAVTPPPQEAPGEGGTAPPTRR